LVKTTTVADNTNENDENFSLSATLTSNGKDYSDSANATILDQDTPVIKVGDPMGAAGNTNDITVPEGQDAIFAVRVEKAAANSTLTLTLADGTALSPADYSKGQYSYSIDSGKTWSVYTGAIALKAGISNVLVKTTTAPDNDTEQNERFSLNATLTSNGKDYSDQGDAIIIDVPKNNSIIAVDDYSYTSKDTQIKSFNVMGNDRDLENDPINIVGTPTADNGTVIKEANGSLTFIPKAGFVGDAKVTYTITDGKGGYDTAIWYIKVVEKPNIFVDEGGVGKYTVTNPETTGTQVEYSSAAYFNPNPQSGKFGSVPTIGTAQVFTTGGSNDYVEAGNGDDLIFAGDTQDYYNSIYSATPEPTISKLMSGQFMTMTDGTLTSSAMGEYFIKGITDEMQPVADLVNAGSGNDVVFGEKGLDALYGNAGDDKLFGGEYNDVLRGGTGNDTLVGGSGIDVLRGDTGADTFKWTLGDQATTPGSALAGNGNQFGIGANVNVVTWTEQTTAGKAPSLTGATDIILDFDKSAYDEAAGKGDRLDLRDLLQGESSGTLTQYLHFEKSGNDTILHISSAGKFTGSAADYLKQEDQTIIFKGVDLGATGSNDQAVIQTLLQNKNLLTD
jgi:Ca2+-binding RTX toxin-like protein